MAPGVGELLNTLGVAQYRVGRWQEAAETLEKFNKLHPARSTGSHPAELAFLAMARHRLGQEEKAKEALGRLREAMKQKQWATSPEAREWTRRRREWSAAKPAKEEGGSW